MTYCRCYSCKYLLRYELKTECGQICAFFVTAGVGLKLHDSNRKTLCNQCENAVFNLTNTRLHTFWSDWFQAMPVVL